MTNWKQDITISIVMFALSAAFGLTALGYPGDANTFPLLLSALLGILAVLLGLKTAMRGHDRAPFIELRHYRGVMRQIVLIIAFILVLPAFGYAIAGFLLCALTAYNAGYGKRKVTFLFSLAASVFVIAVFKFVLQVPLPMGMLFE